MRLAKGVEHAGSRIRPHTASAVLVAHPLKRDPLLEVRVQRHGSSRMPGALQQGVGEKLLQCWGQEAVTALWKRDFLDR